jgi:hypothetical protein
LQCQIQILVLQGNRESRRVVTLEYLIRPGNQQVTRSCSRTREHLVDLVEGQSQLEGKGDSLGRRFAGERCEQVVDQLHTDALAGRTDVNDGIAHDLEQRPDADHTVVCGTDHEHQFAALGVHLLSTDSGVNETHTLFGKARDNFVGAFGIDRAGIYDDHAFAAVLGNAAGAENHFFDFR